MKLPLPPVVQHRHEDLHCTRPGAWERVRTLCALVRMYTRAQGFGARAIHSYSESTSSCLKPDFRPALRPVPVVPPSQLHCQQQVAQPGSFRKPQRQSVMSVMQWSLLPVRAARGSCAQPQAGVFCMEGQVQVERPLGRSKTRSGIPAQVSDML